MLQTLQPVIGTVFPQIVDSAQIIDQSEGFFEKKIVDRAPVEDLAYLTKRANCTICHTLVLFYCHFLITCTL